MREIEQKFRVADLNALARRLLALGYTPDAGHAEADHYLAAPDRDFAQTGEVFRMRRIGPQNFLTYKGPKRPGPFRDREELEVPLPPGEDIAEQHLRLLVHLGYRPVAVVRKQRRQARFEREGFEVTLCLDNVEEVGTYCEVEVLTEPDRAEQAKQLIGAVAAELDLTELEPTSYLGLLLAGRGQ
jgi:adenylate cyclase class 2